MLTIRLRETELEDRLQETLQKLLQAGVDKRESEREVKMRETLSSLRRVIPGVHGRMSELIKPTASKYSYAVDIVLGRNKDAVIVDKESTAISCIDVRRGRGLLTAVHAPAACGAGDVHSTRHYPDQERAREAAQFRAWGALGYRLRRVRRVPRARGAARVRECYDL